MTSKNTFIRHGMVTILLLPTLSYSYEIRTHEKITEEAIKTSNIAPYIFKDLDVSLNIGLHNNPTPMVCPLDKTVVVI